MAPRIVHGFWDTTAAELPDFAFDRAAQWRTVLDHSWEVRLWCVDDVELADALAFAAELAPSVVEEDRRRHLGNCVRGSILDRFGGLWLDLDVELYREPTSMLQDGIVHLASVAGSPEMFVAGSPPRHPFWRHWKREARNLAAAATRERIAPFISGQMAAVGALRRLAPGKVVLEPDQLWAETDAAGRALPPPAVAEPYGKHGWATAAVRAANRPIPSSTRAART